jgi:hypothetical protein
MTLLRDVLASLLPLRQDAVPYLAAAGIGWLTIDLGVNPNTLWYNILTYANGKFTDLVNAVLEKFPKNRNRSGRMQRRKLRWRKRGGGLCLRYCNEVLSLKKT